MTDTPIDSGPSDDDPNGGSAGDASLIEDLVFECLESDDVHTAVAAVCAAHPELADRIRRVITRLESEDFGVTDTTSSATPIPRSEMQLPDEIGGFRLLSRLGAGGMGVVYLAEETKLGRQVAVKLVRPEQLYFAGARVRFQREIEAIARLHHPGIVTIHSVGEEHGVPYFSMDYVRGISLSRLIARLRENGNPARVRTRDIEACFDTQTGTGTGSSATDLPWTAFVIRTVRDVARALEHAHEQGVLHRDVKPSNILLGVDQKPRLLDFGLARTEDAQQITRSTSQLGSLPYMPPEQLAGGVQRQEPTLDVYALGVTLYELLTFRSPFLAETAEETRANILAAAPPRPRAQNSAVDLDLETVCLTAMDPTPARRYLSMAAFLADLDNLLERRPIVARPAGRLLRSWRWVQRHPTASVAIGMATVLFAVTLWFAFDEYRRHLVTQRTNYVFGIAAANAHLDAHRAREAKASLAECAEHLRRFEWHHLDLRSRGASRVYEVHDGRVFRIAVHPDGRRFVTLGSDGAIRMWDRDTGAKVAEFVLPDRRANVPHIGLDCVFDREGARLLVACSDGKLRSLDATLGDERILYEAARTYPNRIALHPDDQRLVCGLFDGRVVVVDKNRPTAEARGVELPVIDLRKAGFVSRSILSLEFDASGRRLAVTRLREVVVVDTTNWRVSTTLSQDQILTFAAMSADGERLLTSGVFGMTGWWRTKDSERLALSDPVDTLGVNIALLDPDRERVIVAGARGTIRVLGATRLETRFRLQGHEATITHMVFAPDGKTLMSASYDGTVREWDASRSPAHGVLARTPGLRRTLHLDPGGERALSAGSDGLLAIDLRDGSREVLVPSAPKSRGFLASAASEDGRRLVLGGKSVTIVDTEDLGDKRVIDVGGDVGHVAFVDDDRRCVAVRSDGSVRLLDATSGEILVSAPAHAGSGRFMVRSLTVCGWCDLIVLGTRLGELVCRDARTLEVRGIHRLSRAPIFAIEAHAGTRSVIAADAVGRLRFRDPLTGRATRDDVYWPDEIVTSYSFSPDGTRLLTGTRKLQLRIWEWPEMRPLLQVSTGAPVYAARFSPDGTRMFAITEDRSLRVWNSRPK